MNTEKALRRLDEVITHYQQMEKKTTPDGKYWCGDFIADLKSIKKDLLEEPEKEVSEC